MIDAPATVDVPLRTDEHGVIRVGDTPEMILRGFPTVSLADIYAVIAYYLARWDEVDTYIQQTEAEAEHRRQEYEANVPKAAAFDAKMRAVLAAGHCAVYPANTQTPPGFDVSRRDLESSRRIHSAALECIIISLK